MLKRLTECMPPRSAIKPVAASFGVALLSEACLAGSINTAATILLAEKMKDKPELIALGIFATALYNVVNTALDYPILKYKHGGGSAKANVLYFGMNILFPKKQNLNVAVAEFGTIALNILGISPDLSGMASNVMSLISGDLTFIMAQRTSSSLVNSVIQLPLVVGLNRQVRKELKNQNIHSSTPTINM